MPQWSHTQSVGWLSHIFQEADPRTAQEQAQDRYSHGGGWMSFKGFTLAEDENGFILEYPEDVPIVEISRAKFRDQTLVLFQYSWVGIIEGGTELLEVSRMD